MSIKNHYITSAAFFLDSGSPVNDEAIAECMFWSNPSLEGKALIRKLCTCGSRVTFDEKQRAWCCLDSGEDVGVSPWNAEPLIPSDHIDLDLEPIKTELSHPELDHLIKIDAPGHIQVFIKVPKERLWVIQDPLPVQDHLSIQPFEDDLQLRW